MADIGLTPARWLHAALAATLLAAAPAGLAATAEDQRYQDERAACMQRPEAERATCLREAAAARQAARSGALTGNGSSFEANRLLRCNALPVAERDACIRRARDEGVVSGSVESGGILREYREVILPPVSPPPTVISPQQAPSDTMVTPPATTAAPPPVAPAVPAPAGVMLKPAQ